ncbi:uncharacterized protein PV06_09115 [Exophiala oligosperma]|uniref:Uncharacterized protein n=1 Tax=Exophiala oligosperma TaxID=215243 RepID=A0A0D2BP80_9EURO|nr:uncharacterized protein PV06_09115 [Exophiala oligosperma]KIW39337.1 hypothetical protein PV06_09115 [Exophiala oligosperma]
MLLYLAEAFSQESALHRKFVKTQSGVALVSELFLFITDLDDALLACLTRIWKRRKPHESFNWASSEYLVDNGSLSESLRCALATSPVELASLGDIKGREIWTRRPGDEPLTKPHPAAKSWAGAPKGDGGIL